ncbi:hydroxycarboxylic acid receptor 2-like [Megalops cyprinoides]|uniref:hydroxycarboxylic acid receptor 2-like n=1 Tax=Megalops cyprinoides TaxID=118141 RepID=UPI001863C77A|nr:hydroxycarboxylic acid receptor 2-like [Megalops cyprinoides]
MSNNSTHHCLAPQGLVATALPPILIIEFLLGLPGNAMALWVFCCHPQAWRPNTVYLLNLVLADFLLLSGLPLRIDNLLRGENWVHGDALCRLNLFMLAVNRSASIAFMTAVAVDRYLKVAHPHHRVNRMSSRRAGAAAGVVWSAVVLLRAPLLAEPLLWRHGDRMLCRSFSSYRKTSAVLQLHYGVYVAEFFLPLPVLVFCAAGINRVLRRRRLDRERKVRRAMWSVVVIATVFGVCFLPGVATGLTALLVQKLLPHDCDSLLLVGQIFSLSIGFTYLNSTLDPVLYCFSSSAFRNTLLSAAGRLGVLRHWANRKESVASEG